MIAVLNCPVIPYTRKVLDTTEQLEADMKALRKAMQACKDCSAGLDCPILRGFEHEFRQALVQVTTEWGFAIVDGAGIAGEDPALSGSRTK